MATLAPKGRISADIVDEEIHRWRASWDHSQISATTRNLHVELLGSEAAGKLDVFDSTQLEAVLQICRSHVSASVAGRALFANSRLEKKSNNDTDRLKKYLARFGLRFEDIVADRH